MTTSLKITEMSHFNEKHIRGQWSTDNGLQNVYMAALFGTFDAKSLFSGGKLVHNINGNPNSPWEDKLFFLNLYKVYNLYILMDLCHVATLPSGLMAHVATLPSGWEFVQGPLNPTAAVWTAP